MRPTLFTRCARFTCAHPTRYGVPCCLGWEILCPAQEFVPVRVAALVEAEQYTLAVFERLPIESQTQVALHVFHERLHGLFQQLPSSLGRLGVAPRMAAGAPIEIVKAQLADRILHLAGNRLE